jgi:hypothetical protein
MGRLVKCGSDQLVVAAADPAIIVGLPGAVALRCQAEMCPDIPRSREALTGVDAGPISERHNHADARARHQSAANRVSPRELPAQAVEPLEFFNQHSADTQHRRGDCEQAGAVGNELQHPCFVPPSGNGTDPQPEHLQRTAHRVLEILRFGQKLLAIEEQHADPLRLFAFDVDLPKPTRPWKNVFAEDGGPTSAVRWRQGLRTDPGTQARIACSSGPTPRMAITRLML